MTVSVSCRSRSVSFIRGNLGRRFAPSVTRTPPPGAIPFLGATKSSNANTRGSHANTRGSLLREDPRSHPRESASLVFCLMRDSALHRYVNQDAPANSTGASWFTKAELPDLHTLIRSPVHLVTRLHVE